MTSDISINITTLEQVYNQAINWTNDDLLPFRWQLGIHVYNLKKQITFMKMHLQMSSKTQRPFFRHKCDKIVTQTVQHGRRNWLIYGTKKELSDPFLETPTQASIKYGLISPTTQKTRVGINITCPQPDNPMIRGICWHFNGNFPIYSRVQGDTG